MENDWTYERWAEQHVALKAAMKAWGWLDARHFAARRELAAIERRMAVLADQELRQGAG